ANKNIASLIEAKEFLELEGYLKANKKAFKDTEAASVFESAEAKLKEKEVKNELKAQESMMKIVADYEKAGAVARKQEDAIKKMRKFAEKNADAACAAKASALADKWEAKLPKE
ncbi:MAG: hypothetical protein KDB07_08820, partial [Planctomycetes bacterium]|nr:hypothetical protein [Planctomycetota bacterium]